MNLKFFLGFFFAFLIMDIVAYVVHRWVMHGFLWSLHRSHHYPRKGKFELNDAFAFFFAAFAILFMALGAENGLQSLLFGIGSGITMYGAAYFFVHDIFTHRRVIRLEFKNKWLIGIRQFHRIHHQSVQKKGQEPFGFLWFRT